MPLWRVASSPEDLVESSEPVVDSSFPFGTSSGASPKTSGLHQRVIASEKPSSPRSPHGTYNPTGPFLVKTEPPPDTNKNTSWFLYPGVWTMYAFTVFFSWLLILSLLDCTAGTAWTLVNLIHFMVTFYLFHWKKGSPFSEDQGVYDKLTWWEQMDEGRQLTRNRKFLTAVPVLLYAISAFTMKKSSNYNSILFLNTIVVFTLVIAKLPILHKAELKMQCWEEGIPLL